MTSIHATATRTLLAGVLGISMAGFAGIGAAQSNSGQPAPSDEVPAALQELQAKQQEIQQLSTELRTIQRKATEANPDLETDQENYRDLVIDAMSDENYDPQAEVQSIRTLQSELQGDGQLGEDERQTKMQALKQKEQEFRTRQQQAMQAEDVKAARQELDSKMRAAMKEQNPEAGNIISELTELQKEYRTLLRDAMQQQGGSGAPQG